MKFQEITLAELSPDPFKLIGKGWMLITAGNESGFNTMTASWGGFGVMWHKNVATVVIRPQRHTLGFIEGNDIFTLSFFTEDYRDALKFCGANSGRNVDKIKKTGLIPIFIDSTIAFEQAEITLICKKLYKQKLEPECFIDKSLLSNYSENDYHIAFTAEIIKALKKQ